jgi:hypothetical protein
MGKAGIRALLVGLRHFTRFTGAGKKSMAGAVERGRNRAASCRDRCRGGPL